MNPGPIGENPFYVLELRPGATPAEIERAGQRLLAMLAVGLDAASAYPSPAGPRPRDADLVRRALEALRDPARRWQHELWAQLPPDELPPASEALAPWPEPLTALGWPQADRGGSGSGRPGPG
ncbi:MAG: hypothetical protein ABMB14_38990 [Myxococcota bacterium]